MNCFLDRCLRLDSELSAKIVQYRYFNKLQHLKRGRWLDFAEIIPAEIYSHMRQKDLPLKWILKSGVRRLPLIVYNDWKQDWNDHRLSH